MTRREIESPQHATASVPSLAPPGEGIRLLVSLTGMFTAGESGTHLTPAPNSSSHPGVSPPMVAPSMPFFGTCCPLQASLSNVYSRGGMSSPWGG